MLTLQVIRSAEPGERNRPWRRRAFSMQFLVSSTMEDGLTPVRIAPERPTNSYHLAPGEGGRFGPRGVPIDPPGAGHRARTYRFT